MILACPACDSRYDVTGHDVGQKFRCRCGEVVTLAAKTQAGKLACPHCGAGVATSAKTCDHCSSHLLLKACPRCLSRVFHGHKHCPDCGAQLDVAAISDAHADRMCPRCPNPLHPRTVGDVVIDECATCHGIFLDHVAVQRVVTDRQQARADAILGMLPSTETSQILPPGAKMYVKCPVCTTMMNRKLFAGGSGVIIDVCRAHGAFFDMGELPKIIAFVMNGGLELAQKKEISRMRDDAKREQQNAQFASMMASRSSTNAGDFGFASSHTAGGAFVDLLFALWR